MKQILSMDADSQCKVLSFDIAPFVSTSIAVDAGGYLYDVISLIWITIAPLVVLTCVYAPETIPQFPSLWGMAALFVTTIATSIAYRLFRRAIYLTSSKDRSAMSAAAFLLAAVLQTLATLLVIPTAASIVAEPIGLALVLRSLGAARKMPAAFREHHHVPEPSDHQRQR